MSRALLLLLLLPCALQAQTFTEVGASLGVNDGGNGTGTAWGDYDNDGDLDLFLVNTTGQADRLYRNNGNGTFTEVGSSAGVADTGSGLAVAWGDYDNDGDLDFFLANDFNQAPRLYRNNGNGTFTDVAASAGANLSGYGLGHGLGGL
ncbi:MAG: VCBS repeat-containing protein [Candidatus Latescibacteria bacterium]|nr:VCBS repeat-containing protein [Candidatus Latescibacterota bacterium]